MAPTWKNVTFNFLPVRTTLSLDKDDVRRQAISLYKAWYRQMPIILHDYHMVLTPEQGRSKLREIFVKNSRITNLKQINFLIMRGQMELNEAVNKQKEEDHIWKYFRGDKKRPATFLSKFLSGQ